MLSRIIVMLGGLTTLGPQALSIDHITCLQAKSKFLACAQQTEEEVPVRDCVAADSGYVDCRAIEGLGSHRRCLPAKGQYKYCRDNTPLTHNECLRADTGYPECIAIENDPVLCLAVKGGYQACRTDGTGRSHRDCLTADSGYADCIALGGNHTVCLNARKSYKYCRETEHQSELFCTQIGKGYAPCRQAGFSLAFCYRADTGFADCANYDGRAFSDL